MSGTPPLALAIRSLRLIDAPITVLNERLDPRLDVRTSIRDPQNRSPVHL